MESRHATASAASDADRAYTFEFAPRSSIGCTWLAGADRETWSLPDTHFRFVELQQAETAELRDDSAALYARLMQAVRGSAYPYLLRIWNYFADINLGDDDAERYRRFCVGRAQAVDAAFHAPPPAATAIGHRDHGDGLRLIALCGDAPAVALENPRQTPAWRYPREFGPVSPGFSRGALLDASSVRPRLLASGTASIVGHVSLHAGDVAEQLRESLRNLDALLREGERQSAAHFELAHCEHLRVYLRDASALTIAQRIIQDSPLRDTRIAWLQGDVCRRELDVELEGVFLGR